MSKFNFRLLVASVTFAVGILGVTLWYNNYCRYSVNDADQNATSSEFRGFNEVTSAADGSFVTTYGWVDPKALCEQVPKDQSAFCNTYLIKDSSEYIKVQLEFCGERATSNCIDLQNSDVLRGSIKIYDANAKLINGSHQIKVTGRITVKDGIGRFAAPVSYITAFNKET